MITVNDFTRVNNDINGNPRYVCHFLQLLTKRENGYYCEESKQYIAPSLSIDNRYNVAVKRANKIGGKKFHNKQYGGGIVFQSYNIQDTADSINELLAAS